MPQFTELPEVSVTANRNNMGPLGTAAFGIGLDIAQGAGNLIFGALGQKQQLKGQRKALAQQNDAAMDLWERTNYPAQVEQMKKAGLNPGLIYGMGGGGGATTQSTQSNIEAPYAGMTGMGIQRAMELNLMKAQMDNIKADTAKKTAEAEFTSGAQTESTQQGIKKMIAETTNVNQKTALMKLDEEMQKIQNNIADSTQWYHIGKIEYDWRTAIEEYRSAAAKAEVDQKTVETDILTAKVDMALKLMQGKALQAGIHLSEAQIQKIGNEIMVMHKEAETNRWNAETNARNAGANERRTANDIWKNDVQDSMKISLDAFTDILQAVGLGMLLKGNRTVIEGFKQKY